MLRVSQKATIHENGNIAQSMANKSVELSVVFIKRRVSHVQ